MCRQPKHRAWSIAIKHNILTSPALRIPALHIKLQCTSNNIRPSRRWSWCQHNNRKTTGVAVVAPAVHVLRVLAQLYFAVLASCATERSECQVVQFRALVDVFLLCAFRTFISTSFLTVCTPLPCPDLSIVCAITPL